MAFAATTSALMVVADLLLRRNDRKMHSIAAFRMACGGGAPDDAAMSVISLACPICGTVIQAAPRDGTVACPFCEADLHLDWDENGDLLRKIESLAAENEVLRLEMKLRELNDRWELTRKSYQIKGKLGPYDPSIRGGRNTILVGIILPVFLLFTKDVASIGVGVGVGVIACVMGLNERAAARRLVKARQFHEDQRQKLCLQLRAQRQKARTLAGGPNPSQGRGTSL